MMFFFHPVKLVCKAWHIPLVPSGSLDSQLNPSGLWEQGRLVWRHYKSLCIYGVDVKSHLSWCSWWCRDFVEFYWFDFKRLWFGGLLAVSMLIGCTPSLTPGFRQLQRARFGDLPVEGETSAELFTECFFVQRFDHSRWMDNERRFELDLMSVCLVMEVVSLCCDFVANTRVKRGSLVSISHQTCRCITWQVFSNGHSAKGCHFKHGWIIGIVGLYLDLFLLFFLSNKPHIFHTSLFPEGDS